MMRASVLVVLAAFVVSLAVAVEQQVFLPPDCDVLKIVGNGFTLELAQFEAVKKDFKAVEDESSKVESPQEPVTDAANSAGPGGAGNEPGEEEGRPLVNENLYDKSKSDKDYGLVDADLLRWIENRATLLINRVSRYNKEQAATVGASRIVLDILLLNTLVDLDNLNKEEVSPLPWVKNKLRMILATDVHRAAKLGEVHEFVVALINRNKEIELKVMGKNDPGRTWVTNTQALKRVLHEQRFSDLIGKIIVEFLAGRFNMMKRSVVYQLNQQSKQLDDGLYYPSARGRVPADFPFAAQDAISHGADN